MVVKLEKRGHIATVSLNRPETRNAMNMAMINRLREIWLELRDDNDVWVVVLTAEGGKSFCVGTDLKEIATLEPDWHKEAFWKSVPQGSLEQGLDFYKPVIAAIDGHCLGIGLTLAMACDLRIATETSLFGFPEVKVGMPTVMAGLKLARMIPYAAAAEMLLIGDSIDANKAFRIGLINYVVSKKELAKKTEELANKLVRNAPLGVALTKELMIRGQELPLTHGLRMGESLRRISFDTEDSIEGPKAFIEKRKPKFKRK